MNDNPLAFSALIKSLLLGFVQGATEFLPVSSSGHMVLTQFFFNFSSPGASVEVFMHLATAMAVVIYFRSGLIRLIRQPMKSDEFNLMHVLISCAITGSCGFLLKDKVYNLFDIPVITGACLTVMGVILLMTRLLKAQDRPLTMPIAVTFGFVQVFALLPGISRSGITIACLLLLGTNRKTAFTFSFLSSLPLIVAAAALEFAGGISGMNPVLIIAGSLVAFATGLYSLKLLEKIVLTDKLHYFGFYCLGAGLISTLLIANS